MAARDSVGASAVPVQEVACLAAMHVFARKAVAPTGQAWRTSTEMTVTLKNTDFELVSRRCHFV